MLYTCLLTIFIVTEIQKFYCLTNANNIQFTELLKYAKVLNPVFKYMMLMMIFKYMMMMMMIMMIVMMIIIKQSSSSSSLYFLGIQD